MKKNSGFTLFELLVVISIIALIVAVASVSFSSAQKRARDVRRIQDLQAIQKAFEQYHAVEGVYPTNASQAKLAMPGYPPLDPKNVNPYKYTTGNIYIDPDEYCICANLENDTGNSTSAGADAFSCSYASGGDGDYYCVSNLQ